MPIPLKIYYRAVRRLIWARYGDLRKQPRPSRQLQDCLRKTYGEGIRFQTEGGAFGQPGWIIRTDSEVAFVACGKGTTIRAFPFEALVETRIQRMALYDYLHLTTRSERATLRVFRAPQDMAQELFNQIQAVMSKRRADGRPEAQPHSLPKTRA